MTARTLEFTVSAQRELERLPSQVHRRLERLVPELLEDPFRPRPGLDIRPLEGRPGHWRLRIGRYRGIYVVDSQTVCFVRFGHRSTVYR